MAPDWRNVHRIAHGQALAALEADLHDPVAFLDGRHHGLSFANVVRDRFLAVDILALVQRGDQLQGMPMGRRADDDRIERFEVEQIFVVLERLGPCPLQFLQFRGRSSPGGPCPRRRWPQFPRRRPSVRRLASTMPYQPTPITPSWSFFFSCA